MRNPDAYAEKISFKASRNQLEYLQEEATKLSIPLGTHVRSIVANHINGGIVEHSTKYSFDRKTLVVGGILIFIGVSTFVLQVFAFRMWGWI